MTTVREGQRVRVVLEGVAYLVDPMGGDEFSIGYGSGAPNIIRLDAHHVVSVEVLRDPEPGPGSVRITADGAVWVRDPTRARQGRPSWGRVDGDAYPFDWRAWDQLDDPRPAVRAEP